MTGTKIGKIVNINLGYGGYQDAQFGLSVNLGGKSWGVNDFKGCWSIETKCNEYCGWSEEDRDKSFSGTMRFINDLLIKAKKQSIDQLKNVPIEVTFEDNLLKSWRILEEVL